MSIATLVQVYDETRRLAIAGSAVAAGDFRLKKLVPPLQTAGEKAPVFAKVAQAVQAVVDSNEKTASAALLDLTTLVNAILYTQGETGAAGELKPLETNNLGGAATQASARVLKPLLEALSSTGSGRLELIRDAVERGVFKDLRLIKPALSAIDDPYSEIGDMICEKVLPVYGKAILPELRGTLDIKAKTEGQMNRLKLIHRLDPEGARELIQKVLAEGSKEMKVVAVECLGTTDDDLAYLLEQIKSKAKDLRAAALRALAAAGIVRADAVGALKNAIAGADLELIIGRVRKSTLPEIQNFVLEQAEKQFAETLKAKDAKAQGAAIGRLQNLVLCLDGRTDAPAEAFVLKCFENAKAFEKIKSEPSGKDFNELVAQVMATGTTVMRERLVQAHKELSGPMFGSAIVAARATMTPAAFYDEFAPVLKALAGKKLRKGSPDAERSEVLLDLLASRGEHHFYHSWRGCGPDDERAALKLPELDPRWLDVALEVKSAELVLQLARPGHAGVNQFLSDHLAAQKRGYESAEILQTMVKIGHPMAVDAILESIKKEAKSTYYHLGYWYGSLLADLPKSALPRIEEFLPTLPDKAVDQLMDSVIALRNKPE
jgi:hypothetical protein